MSETTKGMVGEIEVGWQPRSPVNYSTRVDKVGNSARAARAVRIVIAFVLAFAMLIPVFWLGLTSFKSRADAIAVRWQALSGGAS